MPAVKVIAVIGAGPLGRSFALHAALGGFETILEDLLPNARRRAEQWLSTAIKNSAGNQAARALGRIQYAGGVEQAARAADLVIECVPDETESKREIFTLLDKVCRPGTMLALTSSSESITEIAAVTYRAPCCAGLRFLPEDDERVHLEIIAGRETSAETLAAMQEIARRMGAQASVVRET